MNRKGNIILWQNAGSGFGSLNKKMGVIPSHVSKLLVVLWCMHHGFAESLDFTSDFGHRKGARMGENLSKESLQQAIEENRILVLPARIGQTVYNYHLACFDGCLFQKRKFWDSFGHETGRCGTLPCHTRFHSIEQKEVSLANIGWLFRTWGKSTFATYDEAVAAAHEKVKENVSTLRSLGFKLDASGYSVKSPEMLIWKVSGKNLRTLYIWAECMDDALEAARKKNPNYNTCQVKG